MAIWRTSTVSVFHWILLICAQIERGEHAKWPFVVGASEANEKKISKNTAAEIYIVTESLLECPAKAKFVEFNFCFSTVTPFHWILIYCLFYLFAANAIDAAVNRVTRRPHSTEHKKNGQRIFVCEFNITAMPRPSHSTYNNSSISLEEIKRRRRKTNVRARVESMRVNIFCARGSF